MNKLTSSLLIAASIPNAFVFAQTYLNKEESKKVIFSIFGDGVTFDETKLELDSDQRDKIKEISGVRQRNKEINILVAKKNNEILGWFFTDQVIGKHEYITYSAGISKNGEVLGVEINEYLETHGHEVSRKDWREKFKGKKISDPLKLDVDIPNISGATLSSRNITDGVKRLLTICELYLKNKS